VHGRISNLKLSGQETVSPSEKPGLKGLNPEGSVIAVPSLQFMTADFPSCTRERAIAETPALDPRCSENVRALFLACWKLR
jgi:hypothetical protein